MGMGYKITLPLSILWSAIILSISAVSDSISVVSTRQIDGLEKSINKIASRHRQKVGRGTKKTLTLFRFGPLLPQILFVFSDIGRLGPDKTKITKEDDSTTTSNIRLACRIIY
jgi:hypothetical protein